MRKNHWVVLTKRHHPYSLPGPGDIMLFKTMVLAVEAAEDWTETLDERELADVGPLRVAKLVINDMDLGCYPPAKIIPIPTASQGWDAGFEGW